MTNKIEIINMRTGEYPTAPYDFRCDRRTVVGNPFPMKTEAVRDKVCDAYDIYFYEQIKTNKEFLKYLYEMKKALDKYGKLRLFCWCAPKRCHCETIKKFLDEHVNKYKHVFD